MHDFDLEKMNKAIDEGAKVTVFKKNSKAYEVATKKYSDMTSNQRKRFRKQHKGW